MDLCARRSRRGVPRVFGNIGTESGMLGHMRVSLDTAYGTITSFWQYEGDKVCYEITTPVKATIVIDGKKYDVERGTYTFREAYRVL